MYNPITQHHGTASTTNTPDFSVVGTPAQAAMAGDMAFVITPTAVNKTAFTAARTRTVRIEMKTASGVLHDWYNGTLTIAIADTSSAGTATIPSTSLSMVNGVAVATVSLSANNWIATETNTLTLSNKTVMGYTVTGGTSVETIV